MGKQKNSFGGDDNQTTPHSATSLFIRNLAIATDESELQSHFGGIGPLRTATVVRDPKTGKSRRFAFVRYALAEHAAQALTTLNGSMLNGRPVNLTYSLPRNRQHAASGKGDKDNADGNNGDDEGPDYELSSSKKDGGHSNKPSKNKLSTQKHQRNRPGLRGGVAMRTVAITRDDSSCLSHKDIEEIFSDTKFIPQSIVLCAKSLRALVAFPNWSTAGLAAAYVHGKNGYNAVIDALQQNEGTTVIIRNLPFRISPSAIRKRFDNIAGKPIRQIRFPSSNKQAQTAEGPADGDENTERPCPGFVFVEFFTVADAKHAVGQVNGCEIGGRQVAVDLALGKGAYRKKVSPNDDDVEQIMENGDEGNTDDNDDDDSDDSDGDSDDDDDNDNVEDDVDGDGDDKESSAAKKRSTLDPDGRKDSVSSSEELSRTVFVRNLAYECTGAEIWKAMEKHFGKVEQAVIVKNRATGHSRGCAFVRFQHADHAKKAILVCKEEIANENNGHVDGDDGNEEEDGEEKPKGLLIRGRKIVAVCAVDRQRVASVKAAGEDKRTDTRNLRLAYIGKIDPDSAEGRKLSPQDKMKREKAERDKRLKLSRNPNAFVSDVRLCVRNLPRGLDEKALKGLFELAACDKTSKDNADSAKGDEHEHDGESPGHGSTRRKDFANNDVAEVSHCNIVREGGRGGRSLGFGFVQFEQHTDAWNALHRTNNKPDILQFLVQWGDTERKRRIHIKQKRQQKKGRKEDASDKDNTTTTANDKPEVDMDADQDDTNHEDLDHLTETYLTELWGGNRKRRLIVEFSVEDRRQVRVLERIKERGAEMRKERQQKKEGQSEGDGRKNKLPGLDKKGNNRKRKQQGAVDSTSRGTAEKVLFDAQGDGDDGKGFNMGDIGDRDGDVEVYEYAEGDRDDGEGQNGDYQKSDKPLNRKGKKRKKQETAAHARRRKRIKRQRK